MHHLLSACQFQGSDTVRLSRKIASLIAPINSVKRLHTWSSTSLHPQTNVSNARQTAHGRLQSIGSDLRSFDLSLSRADSAFEHSRVRSYTARAAFKTVH